MVLGILIALLSELESPEAAFAAGVAARASPAEARSHFRRAADLYRELETHGRGNADELRNQGNACLLADDLAGAILAYRKSLDLRPQDPITRALLDHARAQVVFEAPGTFARPRREHYFEWLPRFPIVPGLILATGAHFLGCLAFARQRMVKGRFWRRMAWISLGCFLLTGTLLATQEIQDRIRESRPLVVIRTDGTILRRGNGSLYPRRSETPLPCGVEAELLGQRGDWLRIQLVSGEVGWIPRAAALWQQP